MHEMALELLKGRWNNRAWIIAVYLDELCTFVPRYYLIWRGCDRQSVKELSKPDDGISFSEKRISQRALAAKNGPRIVKWRWRSDEKANCFTTKKR